MTALRFAVVGAGVAGLAAARDLGRHGEVRVFEPGQVGGKILTAEVDGCRVDLGPDAFLTRVPEAVDLCEELGLSGSLVAPTTGAAWLVGEDGPIPMPAGVVLGAPKDLRAVARSGVLSPSGVLRAGLDLVLPRSPVEDDVSVHELIRARFGAQVADRLVDPLVGGIHAGRTEDLSAAATVPQLLAAARRSRSLMRALAGGPAPTGGPVFLTPKGGLGDLVDALVSDVERQGGTVHDRRVSSVSSTADGRVAVDDELYDAAVVATAADEAAALLGSDAPAALATIPRASVAIVLLSYAEADLAAPPGVSGFLVRRSTGMLMTASSFASTKWPHWAPPGTTLVRVSTGRYGDDRSGAMDDDTLVERLAGELGTVLGSSATPRSVRVIRWPLSFPQYLVGHLDKVRAIEEELSRLSAPVAVAGNSYRGSGIPACIASGQRAAAAVISQVRAG